VDLDALGLNSTFDSSGIDNEHVPKLDVVDTSDIGGPEDFTMNMTYWMTADLPLSQIKSRKEAKTRISKVRGDANQSPDILDSTEEGDKAVLEDTTRDRAGVASEDFNSASPTVRVNGTSDQEQEEAVAAETSMDNEEKVMSYLSALPDTDMQGAITSTPLRVAQENALKVPSPAVSRARSLQPTVEDYDTPRKPTQETVIHHPLPKPQIIEPEGDTSENQQSESQAPMDQQELASKTRIAELETKLSYTRAELDAARTENSKQNETIASLQRETEALQNDRLLGKADSEEESQARMEDLREELRLQNLAKLQSQREEFEQELMASDDAKRLAEEESNSKERLLEQLRRELQALRQCKEQEIRSLEAFHAREQQQREQSFVQQRNDLEEKLAALAENAKNLQQALEKATSDAQTARKEAESAREAAAATSSLPAIADGSQQEYNERISSLESRNRSLSALVDSLRADVSAKDQQLLRDIEEQERLEQTLAASEGRNSGLEASVSSLRKQLTDAHRELAEARAKAEQYDRDEDSWDDRLEDARKAADRRVADVEKRLNKMKEAKADFESRLKNLQSEHDSMIEDHEAQIEDVRSNAEDAVRKAGAMLETERSEKRKLAKELKRCNEQLDKLKAEAAKRASEEGESEDEEEAQGNEDASISSTHSDSKATEIETLRSLVKSQASALATLKSEVTTLRKATKTASIFETELSVLRDENTSLKSTIDLLNSEIVTQRAEYEAINQAMDERLAAMLSKMLKERSRAITGKRDDQWVESVGKLKGEKEFMGKVLMREWGRQECGAVEEKRKGKGKEGEKEKQPYRYQYVKRSA
jgi:myosin protein heavy chain